MNEERYQELNTYLNEIFKYCEEENYFFLRNIEELAKMNDLFLQYIMDKPVEDKTVENNMTFEEVLTITRSIIASIDKSYLKDFDQLLETGVLDFSFQKEYDDSCFTHIEKKDQTYNLVNINRKFNYDDVLSLVHEFIHFTNGKETIGANWQVLTEFLSIYFEIYATEYLCNNGVLDNEIRYKDRLRIAKGHASVFSRYEIVFLAYEKFGAIDKNTQQFLSNYILNISEKQFELECYNLYNNLRRIDKKYKEDTKWQKKQGSIPKWSNSFITSNYRYVFGTILAFYARKYVDMDKIIYLNNHLHAMEEKSVTEICHGLGIPIGLASEIEEMDAQIVASQQKMYQKFLMKAFSSMDDYLEKHHNNIKR